MYAVISTWKHISFHVSPIEAEEEKEKEEGRRAIQSGSANNSPLYSNSLVGVLLCRGYQKIKLFFGKIIFSINGGEME
jgi:hypothetical protein